MVHLCLPMMIAMSVGVIYNIVNAGFIGSLHSTPLLCAITFGLPVFALIMAVGGVFGVGAGTAVSRLIGELDTAPAPDDVRRRIRALSAFAVWGSVAAGIVMAVAGLLALLSPITDLLGADAATTTPTAHYVGVMFAFAPVLVVAFAIEQLVRAEGATRASMVGLIVSTAGNAILDVPFRLQQAGVRGPPSGCPVKRPNGADGSARAARGRQAGGPAPAAGRSRSTQGGRCVGRGVNEQERTTITDHGQPAVVLVNAQELADLEDALALAEHWRSR
jgi:hypothetical protein